MPQKTILAGQMALVAAAVLLSLWAATQWSAHALNYSPRLGEAWFHIGSWPVYAPLSFFVWWLRFDDYVPGVFDRAGFIAASGGVLGIVIACAGALWRGRRAANVTTYGSSDWASRSEIKKAGLLADCGVFLGRKDGAYLRHDGPEHVMVFAPTRSGKGVGLVVPTLLSWPHSVLVHDIKAENWALTAGWRSGFSRCIKFDPADKSSPRFNPLMEVRMGDNEVRDAQHIAEILVDPGGVIETLNHWQSTAYSLLVAAILHVLYAEKEKTLRRVAELLTDPARPVLDTVKHMMATNHLGTDAAPMVHPVVASLCRETLDRYPAERSGVISTALTFLFVFRDPVIAEVTSASDWCIDELLDPAKPFSLYLAVPPSELTRTKSLMRLILTIAAKRLTERLPGPERRQVLLMLDEFPALGRLQLFETSLGFMAGYGVKAMLVTQSLAQIEQTYGANTSILTHCAVRVAFATNDEKTAKRISDALGTATEQRSMQNFTGHRLSPMLMHRMVASQEVARPLMTPGEVMQLPGREEIILLSGHKPVRAEKLRYYDDRNFTDRILPAPAGGSSGTGGPVSVWQGRVRTVHAAIPVPPAAGSKSEDAPGDQPLLPAVKPQHRPEPVKSSSEPVVVDLFGEPVAPAKAFRPRPSKKDPS